MGMSLPNLENAHVMQGGHLVSAEISRVIEAIRDYDPGLEVKWVPPAARREGQAAFAVVYNDPVEGEYILFYVPKEEDFDMRVLARVIYNDQRNGQHTWNEFTAVEYASELIQKQKHMDEMEQAADVAAHILRSPLNTYKVNKDFVIKDGIPFNAAKKLGLRR